MLLQLPPPPVELALQLLSPLATATAISSGGFHDPEGVRSAVNHPLIESQVLVGTAGKPESMRGLGGWRAVNTMPLTAKPPGPHRTTTRTHASLPSPFHKPANSLVELHVQCSTVYYTIILFILIPFTTLHEKAQYSNFNQCLIKSRKERALRYRRSRADMLPQSSTSCSHSTLLDLIQRSARFDSQLCRI